MNPEPGAWCLAGNDRLKVLRARILLESDIEPKSGPSRTPGSLLVSGSRVIVSCGSGSLLELIEVQPAGGRPMSAIDWCRGTRELQTLE